MFIHLPIELGKWESLKKQQELLNLDFEIILFGDFNTITASNDRIPYKDQPITRDSKLLKRMWNEWAERYF